MLFNFIIYFILIKINNIKGNNKPSKKETKSVVKKEEVIEIKTVKRKRDILKDEKSDASLPMEMQLLFNKDSNSLNSR